MKCERRRKRASPQVGVESVRNMDQRVLRSGSSRNSFGPPPAEKNSHILVLQLDSKIQCGACVGSGALVLGVSSFDPWVAPRP